MTTATEQLREKYEKQYKENLDYIFNTVLGREHWEEWELEYKKLAEFILLSDHNPYTYMPRGWHKGSLDGDTMLIHTICHALCDDGCIAFIKAPDDLEFAPFFEFCELYDTEYIGNRIMERYQSVGFDEVPEFEVHRDVDRFIESIEAYENAHRQLRRKLMKKRVDDMKKLCNNDQTEK